MRNSLPAGYAQAPPATATPPAKSVANSGSAAFSGGSSFGGYMGAFTHQNSPLKKATSLNDVSAPLPRNSREMAAYEQSPRRTPSPTKHTEARRSTGMMAEPVSFAAAARNRAQQRERYPSRW